MRYYTTCKKGHPYSYVRVGGLIIPGEEHGCPVCASLLNPDDSIEGMCRLARQVHGVESTVSAVLGDAARKGYNLLNPDDLARWKADIADGKVTYGSLKGYNMFSHFIVYGQSPMSDMMDEIKTDDFLETMIMPENQ